MGAHRLPTGFAPIARNETTEFWVVRHGESTWNVTGRYQGQTDVPLSPAGQTQAELLAGRLRGQQFDAVYTSDLERAAQTARTVAARLGAPPEVRVDTGLREIDVGELAGCTHAEIAARFPDYLRDLRADPWNTRRPGGESMADLSVRAGAAFRALRERHPGERVLIFTHGGVVRVAVGLALGGKLEHAWARLSVSNTSVTRFLMSGGGGQLLTFNDAAHLEPPSEETPPNNPASDDVEQGAPA